MGSGLLAGRFPAEPAAGSGSRPAAVVVTAGPRTQSRHKPPALAARALASSGSASPGPSSRRPARPGKPPRRPDRAQTRRAPATVRAARAKPRPATVSDSERMRQDAHAPKCRNTSNRGRGANPTSGISTKAPSSAARARTIRRAGCRQPSIARHDETRQDRGGDARTEDDPTQVVDAVPHAVDPSHDEPVSWCRSGARWTRNRASACVGRAAFEAPSRAAAAVWRCA